MHGVRHSRIPTARSVRITRRRRCVRLASRDVAHVTTARVNRWCGVDRVVQDRRPTNVDRGHPVQCDLHVAADAVHTRGRIRRLATHQLHARRRLSARASVHIRDGVRSLHREKVVRPVTNAWHSDRTQGTRPRGGIADSQSACDRVVSVRLDLVIRDRVSTVVQRCVERHDRRLATRVSHSRRHFRRARNTAWSHAASRRARGIPRAPTHRNARSLSHSSARSASRGSAVPKPLRARPNAEGVRCRHCEAVPHPVGQTRHRYRGRTLIDDQAAAHTTVRCCGDCLVPCTLRDRITVNL